MANKVKALQQWCKMQVLGYRDVNVTNMTSSWRSGLAFCALIHRYRPDLIDYDSLSKDDVFENNKLAFEVAKEKLGIPDLLDAEDMVAMAVPDKLCIVTYVSQYYNVLRNMKPDGGPSEKRSPLKRPQTTTPPDETQPKRITMENNVKDVPKTRPTSRPSTKQSLGDKCHICHQKVYLMERHLEGGKLYHRHCFRESQKSSFRAYRITPGLNKQDSKENISPTTKTAPKAATNGNASSAMSMAKLWDNKIADSKRPPPPSWSPSASAGATSSETSSPALSDVSRHKSPTSAAAAEPEKSTSPNHQARPKTWGAGYGASNLSPRSPRLWSPPSPSPQTSSPQSPFGRRQFSPVSPASSASSSPSPSSRSSPSPRARALSPQSGPLSPGAEDLFPHFRGAASANTVASSRAVPAAGPAEPMEVDNEGISGAWGGTRSPTPRTTTRFSPQSPKWQPSPEPVSPPPPKAEDASLKTNLLQSLSNIRQRYDNPVSGSSSTAKEQSPVSITSSSKQKPSDSPLRPDQPRSILKGGAETSPPEEAATATTRGPRPILKHKDPVSFNPTDCDSSSDNRPPLKSILKSGADPESGPNSVETSPRSILKHHDDASDEYSPRSASGHHGILKTTEASAASDTASGDSHSLRRSILKTKDLTGGACDTESTSYSEDSNSQRPVRSILKSRKSSGDSLLSSSGDELEDLSPRPILKSSPRSESVVSPNSEPRSILKTKNLPAHSASDSARDSPKPILKSRESSPTRSMSPLRVVDPVKPILKKGMETPTPVVSPAPMQSTKSPTGPSVLKAQQSEGSPQTSSSFAAFKSPTARNYTSSSLGLGGEEQKSPSANAQRPVNNMSAFNVEDSIAIAKSQKFNNTEAGKAKQSPDLPVSQLNGAKKTDKSLSLSRPKAESKPEWMVEAEKRQMARKGKYEDPEKSFIANRGARERTVSPPPKPVAPKVSTNKGTRERTVSPPPKPVAPNVSTNKGVRERAVSPPPKPVAPKVTSTNGVSDKKKVGTASGVVPMEVEDDRPEWQKEAEKRQAKRKGFYPDPEKVPVRGKEKPTRSDAVTKDQTGKANRKAASAMPVIGSRVTGGIPSDIAGKPSKPAAAMVPPPKPMRSPMPERAQNADRRPKTEFGEARGGRKPEWQLEAERRQAALQKHLRENPGELQKQKKKPAPPRPAQPPSLDNQRKIKADSNFNFDDERDVGRTTNGNNAYAEIGPPSRRRPRGKGAVNSDAAGDRDSKFANRPLPAVPADEDLDAPPKRRVNAEARLSNRTILRRLEDLDVELQTMEQEGRVLEEKIRSESDDAMDEADLMIAWFELVNKKNDLVRKESDLMYRQRQQELEMQHEELEYDLRCLMDKTDKTASEKIREEALLQELVETVILRNNIVDSIEEDRIRYLEEDQEIAVMMEAKGFSLKDDPPPQASPSPKKKVLKDKKDKDKKKDKNRRLVKSCVQ